MLVATLFPIHLPAVVKMAMMEGLIFSDPFLKMGTAVDSPQLSGTKFVYLTDTYIQVPTPRN